MEDLRTLLPEAARFDGQMKITTVMVSMAVKQAAEDGTLTRIIADERGRAEADLYHSVARELGRTAEDLRTEYEVIGADISDSATDLGYANAYMEVLSLKCRAA